MTRSKRMSGADHSVAVGGSVLGDVSITHIQGRPQIPSYAPPSLPEPCTIPEPGPLPPGSRMLFHRNINFTGRERQLEALAQALLYSKETTLVTQAVQGMGGVGKTQLAVEFAYRYGRFFHGVHWINAAQPYAMGAEIAACGRAMELQPWPETLSDQVTLTLRAWQRGGLRLVILDKLEQVNVARQWLGRLGVGSLRVLLITRHTDWPAELGLRPLSLALFTPAESRAFLRQHVLQADAQALDALAERLGHLPLALELAGRYLKRHRRQRLEDYLVELDQALTHRSMQGWREELGSPTGHDLDIAATFALSWEEVESETAQRLFQMAGYCAPNESIPNELLERAAELDQDECNEALGHLTGLGLLQMEGQETGPTIHPLLAEYARAFPPRGMNDGLPALAAALKTMTEDAIDAGLPECFQLLRPHTRAVAKWAEESGLEQAGALWNNLGHHLKMVADYAGAQAAYERVLNISEDSFGPMRPEVATALNNLGSVLQDLGDLAGAREAYKRALHINEDAFGPTHPEVATALNNLGSVLQDLGDLAGAREAYERALRMNEDAFGPMHPEVATALNNLGSVLQNLGDLAGAQAAYKQALRLNEAVYGPDHPSVAIHANNLGSVLQDLGDLEGARASYERALRIDEAVYGLDHPNVARDVNNLGMVQKAQGDLIGARASFERALRIDEAVYGPDHPSVARDINNLGSVLRDLGDLAGAREAYERALCIDEATFGPDHPNVATRVNNLGVVQQALGDLAGARASFETALDIFEEVLGPEHPNVATLINNLGGVQQAQGDLVAALASYEQALSIDKAAFGADHPNVGRDLKNLGNVQQARGDLAKARVSFERALRIFEQTLGPKHPNAASLVDNLASLGVGNIRTMTKDFLSRARFHINELGTKELLLISTDEHGSLYRYGTIYVRLITDHAPTGDDFTAVCRATRDQYGDDLSHRVALVISDRRPEPGARYRLYEIRQREGLAIVPLDVSLFSQIKPNRSASDILASEIDQATGRQNLYAISGPVSGDLSFFGREPVLQQVIDLLRTGQPVGIFGLRKVGKTSLIQRLQGRLTQQRPIALVDTQKTAQQRGVWSLYQDIIGAFVSHMERYQPKVALPDLHLWPEPGASSPAVADAFIRDVQALHKALGEPDKDKRLLLIVDEIDRLLPAGKTAGYAGFATLFGQLRTANQYARMLDFLVVGVGASLNRVERWEDRDNELYRALREIWMPPMATNDVREMIESLGSQIGVRYEDRALRLLARCGGGQPFVTRQMCARAVEGRLGQGAFTVTLDEAEAAIEEFIFDDPYLREMWRTRLDKTQRQMLRTLAQASEPLPRLDMLPGSQRQESLAALSTLEDYTLVRREDGRYAIAWDVLRRWVRWVELGLEE